MPAKSTRTEYCPRRNVDVRAECARKAYYSATARGQVSPSPAKPSHTGRDRDESRIVRDPDPGPLGSDGDCLRFDAGGVGNREAVFG